MPMMSRQRQLLMAGLKQAEGTVLWGKMRHTQRLDEEQASLAEVVKEGGRPRKARK
jgi:hypothetical protein